MCELNLVFFKPFQFHSNQEGQENQEGNAIILESWKNVVTQQGYFFRLQTLILVFSPACLCHNVSPVSCLQPHHTDVSGHQLNPLQDAGYYTAPSTNTYSNASSLGGLQTYNHTGLPRAVYAQGPGQSAYMAAQPGQMWKTPRYGSSLGQVSDRGVPGLQVILEPFLEHWVAGARRRNQ